MSLRLPAWLGCVLLLAAGAVAAGDSAATETQQLTAINADGFREALEAARADGEPVVLVNFWATWWSRQSPICFPNA